MADRSLIGRETAPAEAPTFPMRFLFDALDPDLFFEFGLNIAGILHAEQEFVYERPIRAEERYTIVGKVHDIWEKQGRSGTLERKYRKRDRMLADLEIWGTGGEERIRSEATVICG